MKNYLKQAKDNMEIDFNSQITFILESSWYKDKASRTQKKHLDNYSPILRDKKYYYCFPFPNESAVLNGIVKLKIDELDKEVNESRLEAVKYRKALRTTPSTYKQIKLLLKEKDYIALSKLCYRLYNDSIDGIVLDEYLLKDTRYRSNRNKLNDAEYCFAVRETKDLIVRLRNLAKQYVVENPVD